MRATAYFCILLLKALSDTESKLKWTKHCCAALVNGQHLACNCNTRPTRSFPEMLLPDPPGTHLKPSSYLVETGGNRCHNQYESR